MIKTQKFETSTNYSKLKNLDGWVPHMCHSLKSRSFTFWADILFYKTQCNHALIPFYKLQLRSAFVGCVTRSNLIRTHSSVTQSNSASYLMSRTPVTLFIFRLGTVQYEVCAPVFLVVDCGFWWFDCRHLIECQTRRRRGKFSFLS